MEFSSGLHSESVAVEFIHEIIPQLGGKLCQSQYKKVSSPKISSVFSKPVAIYAGNYFQGFDEVHLLTQEKMGQFSRDTSGVFFSTEQWKRCRYILY